MQRLEAIYATVGAGYRTTDGVTYTKGDTTIRIEPRKVIIKRPDAVREIHYGGTSVEGYTEEISGATV